MSAIPQPESSRNATVDHTQLLLKDRSNRIWSSTSLVKLLVLSVGFAALVFGLSMGLDYVLLSEHDSPRALIVLSDVLSGAFAGGMFFLYAEARRREVMRRLETIALMNHHIRNALQVISSSAYLPDRKREVEAIGESVERIEWALREILPKV